MYNICQVQVPVIIEEIVEVVRLIPQERIQQRTVEQIVVVPCISSRERNGGSGPDQSQSVSSETELLMCQWRYNAKYQQSGFKTMEVPQIQFLDRVVDRWRSQLRLAREVCR